MKSNIYCYLLLVVVFSSINLFGYNDQWEDMNLILIDEKGEVIDPNVTNLCELLDTDGDYTLGLRYDSASDSLSVEYLSDDYPINECQICETSPIEQENSKTLMEEIFGGIFLRMVGYYDQAPEVGVFGGGELHEKARITMINGILNTREDVICSAKLISLTHGGGNVHYIFRPTLGWSWDIVKSTLVKNGFVSQQAHDIALTWKRLIEEMGGINGGGTIYHYAHSIGAADTLAAKLMLLPEEMAMVAVVTFGSPIRVPNLDFKSVENYASVRDFVPFLRRICLLYAEDNHIIYEGTYFGIPFIDHLLDNGTYRTVIERLGQEFTLRYTSLLPASS